jgi:ABC-type amino acid transport substrate-binding protein
MLDIFPSSRLTHVVETVPALLVSVLIVGLGAVNASAAAKDFKIGARADAPPMSYKDEKTGKFRGYSIDICNRIFERYSQNVGSRINFKFVEVDAFDRFRRLESGEISAICGATTVTIERLRKYDFTFFTFLSGASVMAKIPPGKGLPSFGSALPSEDLRVAIVSATTTRDRMEQLLGTTVSIVPKKTHFEALAALEKDEVDLYVGDRVILQSVMEQRGDSTAKKVGSRFLTYEPYAIPIAVNERALLFAANQAIAELYRSGDIMTIFAGHFSDTAMSPMLDHMYQMFGIPVGKPDNGLE